MAYSNNSNTPTDKQLTFRESLLERHWKTIYNPSGNPATAGRQLLMALFAAALPEPSTKREASQQIDAINYGVDRAYADSPAGRAIIARYEERYGPLNSPLAEASRPQMGVLRHEVPGYYEGRMHVCTTIDGVAKCERSVRDALRATVLDGIDLSELTIAQEFE